MPDLTKKKKCDCENCECGKTKISIETSDDGLVHFKGDETLTPEELYELKKIAQSSWVIRRIMIPFLGTLITLIIGLATLWDRFHPVTTQGK